MAESTQSISSALAASFKGHLTAFHQSLPSEEQSLLEQVWSLAGSASAAEGDVQGFDASSPSLLTVMFSPVDGDKFMFSPVDGDKIH